MIHTKIIPFPPTGKKAKKVQTTIQNYSEGAWNFAHTILWAEQTFPKEDLQLARHFIRTYFELAKDKKIAFISFCERVMITHRYINSQPGRYLPNPSVWFNYNYPHGFTGTKSWWEQINKQRQDIPGYLQHFSIVAEYYLSYITKPSAAVFQNCRKKLLFLKAYSLLQFFYNAIIHFNYSNN